jgi:NAD(P)-dependent dehydrogenase (short-subunit alcohol dehydrogenase family)
VREEAAVSDRGAGDQLLAGRVCLVTGASSGIGRATAIGLARLGATVVLHGHDARRSERALAAVRAASSGGAVELLTADLSSQAETRRLAEQFCARHDQLHVLVNNAGVLRFSRELTVDGLEYTFALNHLSYFLLANVLLDRLRASAPSRVVNVSSVAHQRASVDFDDLQHERRYSGPRAYGQSKLANILFTRELAARLTGSGVTANSLHPGLVATRFGSGNRGAWRALRLAMRLVGPLLVRSPQRGAETTLYLASSAEVEGVTGRYFVDCRQRTPSDAARDDGAARRLWAESERLTGVGETR